jgi:serine/threonine protein kinase
MSENKFQLVNINDYELGETIKALNLGKMKIARNKQTKELILIKVLKKSKILESKQTTHIFNEINLFPALSHQAIPKFIGANHDEKYIYIATEFVPGGDLYNLLRKEKTFSLERTRFYAGQIVFFLDYLHNKNIVFRNLKLENLLIDKNGYLKIVDFILAKEVKDRTYTMCGTASYLAPEIILNKGYGLSVDWWALGILIYEMIGGVDPFSDEDVMKTYENILERKLVFSSDFDDGSKSLIKHLLEPDLSKRYGNLKNGVDDIKSHRFFKELNWNKLLKQEIKADYIPEIKSDNELSNYTVLPDENDKVESLSKDKDPFYDLFK